MKTAMFSCALVLAGLASATAGTVYSGPQMQRTTPCPSAIIVERDGKKYFRAEDCPPEFSQFSSPAIPLDGYVNNASRAQTRHFKILPSGRIELY